MESETATTTHVAHNVPLFYRMLCVLSFDVLNYYEKCSCFVLLPSEVCSESTVHGELAS